MVRSSAYLGLFLLALSNLMYEVLITRIFSVTTGNHFGFLAISIAMFGISLGGIAIYVKPNFFSHDKTEQQISCSAAAFALFSVLAILFHIYCPFLIASASSDIVISTALFAWMPVALLAFIASGIGIALCLTRFPQRVNSLYASDLAGAAIGCLSVIVTLKYVDAIADVFLVAAIALLSALCFATTSKQMKVACVVGTVLFAGLTAFQGWSYSRQTPLVSIRWSKGKLEGEKVFQLWNSFSRIRVFGEPYALTRVDVSGLSNKHADNAVAHSLYLDIDGGAGTPILEFKGGNVEPVRFLEYEISNFAYHLRKDSDVLVIGMGGGKDVLSALLTKQKHVTAVEINDNIIKAVCEQFGAYTGPLSANPKVSIVNDEARSYVTRSKDKFDIIQISMIDTWAATASGAHVLSEANLYTIESFRTLLNHLNKNGILTVSRWYAKGTPAEFYRLTALAGATLKGMGVQHPENNMIAIRNISKLDNSPDGVGTLLVSPDPFSATEIASAQEWAKEMGFDLLYAPGHPEEPIIAKLAAGEAPASAAPSVPFNLKPSTDDNPFFFQTLSLPHFFSLQGMENNMNFGNVLVGIMLLFTTFATAVLCYFCIRIPYVMTADKQVVKAAAPLFLYFFAIGAGYMLVEMSQIQRLTLYLGHPVYGLSVVLFALLLSTGLGSFMSQKWFVGKEKTGLAIILSMLAVYAVVSPFVFGATNLDSTPVRIAVAIASLMPVGAVLGFAFPIGMKAVLSHNESLAPWLWGINGAASVFCSVLAVIIAMFGSISASFITGMVCYAGALLAFKMLKKQSEVSV